MRSLTRAALLAAGCAAVQVWCGTAGADVYVWSNPAGGFASDPTNWNSGMAAAPPGAGDALVFPMVGQSNLYSVAYDDLVMTSASMSVSADVSMMMLWPHTTGPLEIQPGVAEVSRLTLADGSTLNCGAVSIGAVGYNGTGRLWVQGELNGSGDITVGPAWPSTLVASGVVNVVHGRLQAASVSMGTGRWSSGTVEVSADGPPFAELNVSQDLEIGHNGDANSSGGVALLALTGRYARVHVTGTTYLGDPDSATGTGPWTLRLTGGAQFETTSLVVQPLGYGTRFELNDGWVVVNRQLEFRGSLELNAADADGRAGLDLNGAGFPKTIEGGLAIGREFPATVNVGSGALDVIGWVPDEAFSVVVGASGTLAVDAGVVKAPYGYRQHPTGTMKVGYWLPDVHGLLDAGGANAVLEGELDINVHANPAQAGVECVVIRAGDLLNTSFAKFTAPPGWIVVYDRVSMPQTVSIRFTGTPIPCIADFNMSGLVSVQDIFDFLAAYFSGCAGPGAPPCYRSADINNSGMISVQDIFDFLAQYFAGCP